ncbi:hypothetical protein M405DRAFT_144724 [Rhizopogon salebrosus TDB-379]|nr:hypothetical protein M405DRAFT_144724 [Rhizopogon salebrosus TDB-379]
MCFLHMFLGCVRLLLTVLGSIIGQRVACAAAPTSSTYSLRPGIVPAVWSEGQSYLYLFSRVTHAVSRERLKTFLSPRCRYSLYKIWRLRESAIDQYGV